MYLSWRFRLFCLLCWHSASAHPEALAPSTTAGVSGQRFSGEAFRELPREELRFAGIRRSDLKALRDEKTCDRWIVVTSIFQPSPATRKLGELTKQGWCYVVVADKNGPKDYDDVEGVIYLTVERQRALHFHIMDHLPWRHFGRKNVGFLYAIAHGAKIIYDTDDDNRLKEARIPILGLDDLGREDGLAINVSRPDVGTLGHGLSSQPGLLNPYPSFRPTCGHIWPRGFPLDFVQSPQTFNRSLLPVQLSRPPAIQQFLADEDPDVDAIFRLTRPLPCSFQGPGEGRPQVVAVPPQFFTPYNAQCTVHLYEAFWGLLLPVTVHGRVSDIWRAYLTQKLLWDVGQVVTFMPSHVVHDRVAHDYLKDFQSEGDLQLKSTALVSFLARWSSDAPTLVERIEQLWAALYMRGFVELGDVRLAQAWIRDLISVGYDFPELQLGKIMWVPADGMPSTDEKHEL
ncbi:STL1 [Symbiodinium sp. CCMP2592]|nr:STL1 [Symbiodinium sp. CCMP2592]